MPPGIHNTVAVTSSTTKKKVIETEPSAVTNAYSIYNTLTTQLNSDQLFTDDDLDSIKANMNMYFAILIQYGIDVTFMSSSFYSLVNSQRDYNAKRSFISYPPEYVFPRNPDLSQFLIPITLTETYATNDSGLTFDFGFNGLLCTIKTSYPPYLNRIHYDFKNKVWMVPQIVFTIGSQDSAQTIKQPIDITPYFINSVVNFAGNATGIYDQIYYYFDGEKLITNYDFSNISDQQKVFITYSKLLNTIRVKGVLRTNMPGISYYTPTVDQYTLIIDKQRVLN